MAIRFSKTSEVDMRIKLVIATLLGTMLTAGASGACLAGDMSRTGTARATRQDQPQVAASARSALTEATETETKANVVLEEAVSERDAAQNEIAETQEQIDSIKAKLGELPAHDADRAALERDAARLRGKINHSLFARLDAAKDRVTTAKQALDAAQATKEAAVEQVRRLAYLDDDAVEVADTADTAPYRREAANAFDRDTNSDASAKAAALDRIQAALAAKETAEGARSTDAVHQLVD